MALPFLRTVSGHRELRQRQRCKEPGGAAQAEVTRPWVAETLADIEENSTWTGSQAGMK